MACQVEVDVQLFFGNETFENLKLKAGTIGNDKL